MTDVVETCRRTWRRLGVRPEIAAEMAVELQTDLEQAGAAGVPAATYVAGDPEAFAAAWATERGVVRPRFRIGATVMAAILGAVPGVGIALFAAYGLSSAAFGEIFGHPVRVGENAYQLAFEPPSWLYLTLYALGAMFAYAGAVLAVGAVLRLLRDPGVARTVRLLAKLLPIALVISICVSITFAWTQDFSDLPWVAITDAVVAIAAFAISVALVRSFAVREERV